MTPELWQRLKPLFEEAMEQPPTSWGGFIQQACGDDEDLRRCLTELLELHAQRGATLDEIALGLQRLTVTSQAQFEPSEVILNRFQIRRLLGSGGMGHVYEAWDLDLGQTVAIKSIRPEIAEDENAVSRFKQEVQLARRFGGPNICRIHEFFAVPGDGNRPARAFLTMEFLEGITLAEKLRQAGPIPWQQLRPFALDVCNALAVMHEGGVIHRDLKSRNIMLVQRQDLPRAVLMDFGLAFEVPVDRGAAQTALTIPGGIVGTPEYMAPEQFQGLEACAATDIYSMGVVLYESLTGKRPAQALERANGPFSRSGGSKSTGLFRQGVPRRVKRVVERCLEPEPRKRYQSAAELVRALAFPKRPSWSAAAALLTTVTAIGMLVWYWGAARWHPLGESASDTLRSLAVLPLHNLTGDSEQEYFADGMTDELTTSLAQIANLRVPSLTSTMLFKNTKEPISKIAKELKVDAVLEGSVARSGQRVRVSVQLIDTKDDRHIWAKSYERETRDIIALQDELARDVAGEVRLTLNSSDRKRLTERRSVDPKAYEAYLRGRYLWSRRTEPELKRAEDYFKEAIAIDPGFAPAYAGLSDTYFDLAYAWGQVAPKDGMPLAEAAAVKAIDLDDTVADGHASLGEIKLMYDWDLAGAEQQLKRALALNPNNVLAHELYAVLLAVEGRSDESVNEARKGKDIDPLSIRSANMLGGMLAAAGRCEESIAETEKALELDPNPIHVAMLRGNLEFCYGRQGKTKEAFEEELKVRAAKGANASKIEELRGIFARSGFNGIWEKDLKEKVRIWSSNPRHTGAFDIAWLYAKLGQYDQAFAWIDKCIEARSSVLIWMYVGDSPFYGNPRITEFKRKMGLQH